MILNHVLAFNYSINYLIFLDFEKAKKKLKDWGLSISPSLVVSEGPVYKHETIILGNQQKIQVGNNMEWSMDVRKNPMFITVSKFIKQHYLSLGCLYFKF